MEENQHPGMNRNGLLYFFARHRYLVRLIAIGILIVFVITLSSSVLISARSYRHLRSATDSVFDNIAGSVGETLGSYLALFREIGLSCLTTPYTYEDYIYQSALENMEGRKTPAAYDLLNGYSLSMPMITGIGLYYHASGNVLYANYGSGQSYMLTTGWGSCLQYCRLMMPEFLPDDFRSHLDETREAGFLADEALLREGRMVYLMPLSIREGVESRRVLIFDISAASFKKSIAGILGSRYTVQNLSYRGQVLYRAPEDDQLHLYEYTDPNGFSMSIGMPEELYQSTFNSYRSSVIGLGIISVILCLVMIGLLIVYSYRPLNQIARQTRGEIAETDEIAAIKGYITRKEQLENDLRSELENQKEMERLQHIEMMLLGIPYGETEEPIFDDTLPCHYVAVASLHSFPAVNSIVETLRTRPDIIAFEQYRSGYLAMIVGVPDETGIPETRKVLASLLGQDVPFGTGELCRTTGQLHHSFMDAILDLNAKTGTGEKTAVVFPDAIDQIDFSVFRAQVVSNDISCVQSAADMLAGTDVLEPSMLLFWHSNLQIIEKIYAILREYGYQINDEDTLRYAGMQDVHKIRKAFLSSLEKTVAAGPMREAKNETELGNAIIEYIQDNMSNELFGITDLTDTFNLSEYTVSKLIQSKTNTYFKKYLSMIRLKAAKEYLESGNDNIQEISQHCGFSSSSYFIRVFRSEMGVTPLQYRNSLKKR